jgi:uncharacterized protein (TIGR02145 family)
MLKPWLRAGFLLAALASIVSCSSDELTDIDGKSYRTVKIGTQVWMAENLRVTHYRNGDPIPIVTAPAAWAETNLGACCNYDNDDSRIADFGRLYNWFAVTDSRGLAPSGWHVPSDAEWQMLVDHLGGYSVAGGRMKDIGTGHWVGTNGGATDESRFSARPGGDRSGSGHYHDIGALAYFWSSSSDSTRHILTRGLNADNATLGRFRSDMQDGLSVRCVKN